MTYSELAELAEAHLKKTTVSYPEWVRRRDAGKYTPKDGSGTEWGKAFAALAQIDVEPPPPDNNNTFLPNAFLKYDPAGGVIAPSPWRTEGASSSFSIVNDADLGKALQLAVGPGASGPNASSYLASVFVNAGVPNADEGDRTKYRTVIKIPTDFKTSSGEWQFAVEWHVPFSGPYSTCLGIFADGDANQPIVGTNPRWWFEVRGGSIANPVRHRVTLPANEFQLGAVYVHDFDFVWSVDPTKGRCVWTVNGQVRLDRRQATLYTNGPTNAFGVYNYRKLAPFDTRILFGKVSAAPA